MRICSPQLGISPASNLGGTVSDRETLTALAALGVDIHIPLPKNEAYAPVAGWHIYPSGRHLRYYYEYNWLFLPAALKIWRRVGFDLLRIHSPTIGLLGRLLHTVSGRPTVAHYHHIEAHDPIHNAITRQVIHHYDLVTTPSQFALEQLVTHFGFNRQKGLVVYPGVDPQYRVESPNETLRQRLELADKVVALYVGVLAPRWPVVGVKAGAAVVAGARIFFQQILALAVIRQIFRQVAARFGNKRAEIQHHVFANDVAVMFGHVEVVLILFFGLQRPSSTSLCLF